MGDVSPNAVLDLVTRAHYIICVSTIANPLPIGDPAMTLPERVWQWCLENSPPKYREMEFQGIIDAMTGDGEYEPTEFHRRVIAEIMGEHNARD